MKIHALFTMAAESLKYTSAVAVGLTVYFILIVICVTSYKLALGTIKPPALFPTIDSLGSFLNLFSAVPVLVCAFVCHFNGYNSDHPVLFDFRT